MIEIKTLQELSELMVVCRVHLNNEAYTNAAFVLGRCKQILEDLIPEENDDE